MTASTKLYWALKSCEECETTESMLIDTIYTLLPFMCICSVVEQTWTTWILSSCWRCTWLRRTQPDVSLVKLLVYGWRKPGFISWTKQDGPDKYGQPMCIKTINAGCCWESSDHRIEENHHITIDRPSDKQPCGQQFVRRHHSLPKSIGVPLKTPGSFSKTWGNAKSIPSLLSWCPSRYSSNTTWCQHWLEAVHQNSNNNKYNGCLTYQSRPFP